MAKLRMLQVEQQHPPKADVPNVPHEPPAEAAGRDKILERDQTESLITRDRNSSGSLPMVSIQGQKPQLRGTSILTRYKKRKLDSCQLADVQQSSRTARKTP